MTTEEIGALRDLAKRRMENPSDRPVDLLETQCAMWELAYQVAVLNERIEGLANFLSR